MAYSYSDPRSIRDLPEALLSRLTSRLHVYSTALFRVWISEEGLRLASLIGSGTFVTIRGNHGILTAQHVPDLLRPGDSLGLSAAREGEEHAMVVQRSSLRVIEVAPRELDEFGPDLAFIVMADWDDVATVKAAKAFHPLDPDASELLHSPPPLDGGIWFFCGAPGEVVRDEPSASGFLAVKSFKDLCLAGGPTVACQRGEFDYFDLDAESTAEIPSSFGGMSGGGLWQVTATTEANGQIVPFRYLFSGVNFYQGVRSNGLRYMRCHGRRSVYEHAFRAVSR